MASTAKAYDNPDLRESEKFSTSRIALVRRSSLPRHRRDALAMLMEHFSASGDNLFMSAGNAAVAIGGRGRVNCRHIDTATGRRYLGPCEYMSRRAVFALLKALVDVDKVLRVKHEANSWVQWKDEWEFRHKPTYELVAGALSERKTPKQHRQEFAARAAAEQEEKRKGPQRVPPPAPPAQPQAKPAKVAETQPEHRSTSRITRDERLALFGAYIALKKSGMTHGASIAEVGRQFKERFSVDDVDLAVKIVSEKKADQDERRENSPGLAREQRNRMEAATGVYSPSEAKPPPRCYNCNGRGYVFRHGPGSRTAVCADCKGTGEAEPEDSA